MFKLFQSRDQIPGSLLNFIGAAPKIDHRPAQGLKPLAFSLVLGLFLGGSMPISTIDFNSDFEMGYSYINVKDVNCHLRDVVYVVFGQDVDCSLFPFCDKRILLICAGTFYQFDTGTLFASYRLVGFLCQQHSSIWRLFLKPLFHILRMIIGFTLQAKVSHCLVYLSAIDVNSLADRCDCRFLLEKLYQGFLGWKASCQCQFPFDSFTAIRMKIAYV